MPHIWHSLLLEHLPPGVAEADASRLLYKHFERGETLYKKGDRADRMYVIASSEVSRINLDNLDNLARRQTLLHDYDAFGGMAFLTGACHTFMSVVALFFKSI